MNARALGILVSFVLFACGGGEDSTSTTDDANAGGGSSAPGGSTGTSTASSGSSTGGASAGTGGSSDPTVATSVTGSWCGLEVQTASDCTGDEVFYAELAESGGNVTGQWCEFYGGACYSLATGTWANDALMCSYTFDVYVVELSLVPQSSTVLEGTAYSSKCDCELPVTLYKIP